VTVEDFATCPRSVEVGVYLLDGLTDEERADYAAHLAHCPGCLREVGRLAGLPGLLARAADADSGVRTEGHPGPLRPPGWRPPLRPGEEGSVAAALDSVRRRRGRLLVLTAVAFMLVGALGAGVASTLGGRSTGVTAADSLPVPLQPVDGAPAVAAVDLTDRPWGTEIVLRCRYLGGSQGTGAYQAPVYVLVAAGTDGSTAELARWTAVPGLDVVLASATQLGRGQLAGLQVRDGQGTVVLRTVHL
jgi:hypothetical protein